MHIALLMSKSKPSVKHRGTFSPQLTDGRSYPGTAEPRISDTATEAYSRGEGRGLALDGVELKFWVSAKLGGLPERIGFSASKKFWKSQRQTDSRRIRLR